VRYKLHQYCTTSRKMIAIHLYLVPGTWHACMHKLFMEILVFSCRVCKFLLINRTTLSCTAPLHLFESNGIVRGYYYDSQLKFGRGLHMLVSPSDISNKSLNFAQILISDPCKTVKFDFAHVVYASIPRRSFQ